jgi:hypothetical protein
MAGGDGEPIQIADSDNPITIARLMARDLADVQADVAKLKHQRDLVLGGATVIITLCGVVSSLFGEQIRHMLGG